MYAQQLHDAEQATCDDEHDTQHKTYAMRAYLLYLVGTPIFMEKSVTYVNVIYMRYLDDSEHIHEYNWGTTCLVYMYSKLVEGCMWKNKHVISSITLLTLIFMHHLVFVSDFHNTFATSIFASFTNDLYVPFSGLDPPAIPTHNRMVMYADL